MTETLLIIFFTSLLMAPITLKLLGELGLMFSLATSYLLGIALWTYAAFIGNLLGISFTLENVFIIYFFIFTFSYLASRFVKNGKLQNNNLKALIKPLRFKGYGPVLIILLLLLAFLLMINLYWPVKDWDSLVLYDFRAKLFALHGGMEEAINQGYFVSYPLMTSLSHTIIYLINPLASPMLLYFFYYLSLLTLFYYSLKKLNVHDAISLPATLALAGYGIIFDQSLTSYTNLPYTVFLFTGYVFSILWYKYDKNRYLIFSSLFIGFSGWVRFAEPFWIVLILVVALMLLTKRKYLYIPFYAITIYVMRYPWLTFVKNVSGTEPTISNSLSKSIPLITKSVNLEGIYTILKYLYVNIFSKYGILILIFLFLFYYVFFNLKIKFAKTYLFDLLLVLGIMVTVVSGTFLFSLYQDFWQDIGDSARRMSMVLVPILIFASTRLFSIIANKK